MSASIELIKAVAVTAELCGRVFSDAAAEVFVSDLEGYPEGLVIAALARCRKEVRGILTVQDVISRIDDGRPGADEAWAMMPFSETQTVVWTDEMAKAWGVAQPMADNGDHVSARMAFKEVYNREVAAARDRREMVRWIPSLGTDKTQRASALEIAVKMGRLTNDHAKSLLPAPAPSAEAMLMLSMAAKPMLSTPEERVLTQQQAFEKLAALRAILANRKKVA